MPERGIPWDDKTCPWIVTLPLGGSTVGIEPERYVCQKPLPCPDHEADGTPTLAREVRDMHGYDPCRCGRTGRWAHKPTEECHV